MSSKLKRINQTSITTSRDSILFRYVRLFVSQVAPYLLLAVILSILFNGFSDYREYDFDFGHGDHPVRAQLRASRGNSDGSVDYLFRLYPSKVVDYSKMASESQPQTRDMREYNTNKQVITMPPKRRSRTSLTYPITLDADYVINAPELCQTRGTLDYLIIVHSAASYVDRRKMIRNTFGARNLFGNVTQRVVFMLGITSDPVTTQAIQEEAMQHADIVQGPFIDSYRNLTHKCVLAIRWAAQYCNHARLVVKIDDDVWLSPFKLVSEILPTFTSRRRHIACQLRRLGTSIIHRNNSKWPVNADIFKGYSHYPFPHCQGFYVVMTTDLLQPLFRAAWLQPFFWIDDVYLWGMLPAALRDVTFVDLKKRLTTNFVTGEQCIKRESFRCDYLAVARYRKGGTNKLWHALLTNLTERDAQKYRLYQTW